MHDTEALSSPASGGLKLNQAWPMPLAMSELQTVTLCICNLHITCPLQERGSCSFRVVAACCSPLAALGSWSTGSSRPPSSRARPS